MEIIISFWVGVAFAMVCAFVGTLLREPRNPKYCPTCGRMLLDYEKELEWKRKRKERKAV